MAKKKTDQDKERVRFEEGKADKWSAGTYGSKVRVFKEAGKLKVSFQDPATKRPRQDTLFSTDSVELRRRATAAAVALAEKLRSGEYEKPGAGEPEAPTAATLDLEAVAQLYMARVPTWRPELLDPQGHELRRWYVALPESVRRLRTTPSLATVRGDLTAFRRFWRSEALGRKRRVLSIDSAEVTAFANALVAEGLSPRTVANTCDRMSQALRYVMIKRRSVGLTYNPFEGRQLDRTKASIPPYTLDEVRRLRAAAARLVAKGKAWQVFVLLGISSSGRRIGAAVQLTAADHDFEANTVLWQAEHAKRRNYGRGDELRPMTALHRAAVEWAIRNRPNPLGPECPLVWSSRDPSRPTGRFTIESQLRRLEKAADVQYIPQRGLHSMRRAVVTEIADALGDGKAAEFVGMTVATVRAFSYKDVVAESMEEAAAVVNRQLGDHPAGREEG